MPSDPAGESSGELGLVSFNLRYDTVRDGRHRWVLRRRAVTDLLGSMPWDVCGLQEVLARQRSHLEGELPGTRWYGVGRADGAESGEQTPVVVRGEAWAVTGWQTRWLSASPDEVGSRGWDARLPRVATVARLSNPGSAQPVAVVNAHFDHRGKTARIESAKLIASWVAAEPSTAWIVLGDLNCLPGSAPLRALAAVGLHQALPDDEAGTEHGWTGRTDRDRIDHILVDKSFDVLDASVDHSRPGGVLPSDHWPVRARVRLRCVGASG